MKNILAAIAVVLLLGSTAYGQWYVWAKGRLLSGRAGLCVSGPGVRLSGSGLHVSRAGGGPVSLRCLSPVVPAPVVAPMPVWYGPPGVVVRSKVYIPGRPVRNVVRAVLP